MRRLFAIILLIVSNAFCDSHRKRPPNIPYEASFIEETGGYVLGKKIDRESKQILIWDSDGKLFSESQINKNVEITTFYAKSGKVKYRTKGIFGSANHKEIPIENFPK